MSNLSTTLKLVLALCFGLLVFGGVMAAAQEADEDCPAVVAEALELAEEVCEAAASSELCYGHLVLEAEPQPDADNFRLEEPGDIEPVGRVRSVRLSPMETQESIWGVAFMRVRAALTGGFDAEDVTFLLFGDVVVDNAVNVVEVTALRDGNLRQQPSTNAAIAGVVAASQPLMADGRTEDSAWIRVRLDETFNAWISATLIEMTEAVDGLAVVDAETAALEGLLYNSMQAFYFRSGTDDAPCAEAPNSGILIQTPEGELEVALLMNEANIQLRATAFVQADPGENMTVYVIEGEATVEAEGVTRTLLPGTSVSVPLNEAGEAAGAPSEPVPYEISQLQALPLDLLERPVTVAEPFSSAGRPVSGDWNFFWLVEQATCPDGQVVTFTTENPLTSLRVEDDGSSFTMLLTRYTRDESGAYRTVFTDASGNIHHYTVRAAAIDRLTGDAQIDYLFGCTLNVPFELRLVNAASG